MQGPALDAGEEEDSLIGIAATSHEPSRIAGFTTVAVAGGLTIGAQID
jgi:hypothetical protein